MKLSSFYKSRKPIGNHEKVPEKYIRKEESRRACGVGWDEYIWVSSPLPPCLSLFNHQNPSFALAINKLQFN